MRNITKAGYVFVRKRERDSVCEREMISAIYSRAAPLSHLQTVNNEKSNKNK